ncbi:MAG: hypothetical protein ACFB12_09610 [Leptolyngbyaceae cyanobacterium]
MARVSSPVLDRSQSDAFSSRPPAQITPQQAQVRIFDFLLEAVKTWPPEDVLDAFKNLFFCQGDTVTTESSEALYALLFSGNKTDFHNTLKRSCYILVNNWEVARQFEAIQSLVQVFQDESLRRRTFSLSLKRLRGWLGEFIESEDYRELQLFASRLIEGNKSTEWTSRYTSYLLVSQYMNAENPVEQREVARSVSRRLKDKFKFELAMYTAHSQSALPQRRHLKNPTALGDSALRLIKLIVAKRGQFSHKNLANLFLKQTEGLTYGEFKNSLLEYLVYSVSQPIAAKVLRQKIDARLASLYEDYHDAEVDPSLRLRTCNRIIDQLMTEDKQSPSELFTLLLSQNNALSLAIILLKLILISQNSHLYLEARIADLIRYYEQFPQEDCTWVINFLEIFQVTFAIYAENVEYNLINFRRAPMAEAQNMSPQNTLDACRVFSQLTQAHSPQVEPTGEANPPSNAP